MPKFKRKKRRIIVDRSNKINKIKKAQLRLQNLMLLNQVRAISKKIIIKPEIIQTMWYIIWAKFDNIIAIKKAIILVDILNI